MRTAGGFKEVLFVVDTFDDVLVVVERLGVIGAPFSLVPDLAGLGPESAVGLVVRTVAFVVDMFDDVLVVVGRFGVSSSPKNCSMGSE